MRHRHRILPVGYARRQSGHLARRAAFRLDRLDARLPRRTALQFRRQRHRTRLSERSTLRRAIPATALRGQDSARVLLLDADLLLRQRSLLLRRRHRQRGTQPHSGAAAHGCRRNARDSNQRLAVDRAARRPDSHLRQRGQPAGSLLRLHAHRQNGHVEQGVGHGPRSAATDRGHLRPPVAVRLRPEHPLPQQEHSRIHHGDSAHLHAGRSHLYLQRGLHLPALSAFGQLVHLRRRRHSRTRRSGDRMDGHAAERLLLSGTPIQDGQGYPRQIQHGVGL